MQRLLSAFKGLRWKLTLTYTLVTVAALLVVEIVGLFLVLQFVTNSAFMPRLAARVIVNSASGLIPFLDKETPDLNGLNSWLISGAMNGLSAMDERGQRMSFYPASLSGGDASLLVLDARQNLLAVTPPEQAAPGGQPISSSEELQTLLAVASEGESNPERLFVLTPENKLFVAAPIQDAQRQVLGFLVFHGTVFPLEQPYGQLIAVFGASLVFFTLAAGAVGTLFGFISARGLSRRLHRVSATADSWSRGDFTAFIYDKSGDELGQLARRLNLMAEQLQNLLQARQELATLEERNRLARDLHDSVKQQVFATVMQVGAARALLKRDPQAAETHLAEAEQLARQAQAELTGLIRELRPATLQGRGLVQALQEYTVAWSRQNSIPVDMRLEGERGLPLSVEQALFRVAQEALSNIARHSAASRVALYLAWERDEVAMTIADDGSGFDLASAEAQGVGLRSMRERTEALGGQLTVDTAAGHGTRLRVVIGLQNIPLGHANTTK